MWVRRKVEKEIEAFIEFEKTFLNHTEVILNELTPIVQSYSLGETAFSDLSNIKTKIKNVHSLEEYSQILDKLKRDFCYHEVEIILRMIHSIIRESNQVKFDLSVNKIISLLKDSVFINQNVYNEIPNILFAFRRDAITAGSAWAPDNKIKKEFASYKITDQSLENLRKKSIPDRVLEGLRFLRGKHFTKEDKFLNAIEKHIGKFQSESHKELILKYALFNIFPSQVSESGELKLANDLIKELSRFIELQTQRCITLVSKAGYGKTNTLCRIAEHLIENYPVILLSGQLAITNEYDIEFHIYRQIRSVFRGISSDWINQITSGLNTTHKWLFIIIDGINENSNFPLFIRILKNFLPKIENKRIKIILSCRDIFWDLFSSTLKPYLFQGETLTLSEFTEDEWRQAVQQYLRRFNIVCKFNKNAKLALRNPLLLRFFCEAYRDRKLDELDNIKLLSLFDLYIEQLGKSIAERFGFFKDLLIGFLLKIGGEMWRARTTSLPFSALGVTLEEFSKITSIYNLVKSENIVLEESWHPYVTQKTVRFVYDEFMEYIIARNWANQILMSKKVIKEIEPLLQEAVDSINTFSPAFGSILFLDKMLECNGTLVNRAIAIIGSINDTFMTLRQTTMLCAFENMSITSIDDKVIFALGNFESIARNEIKERLAPIIIQALKQRPNHPIVKKIVSRILEIDPGEEKALSATQEKLRDELSHDKRKVSQKLLNLIGKSIDKLKPFSMYMKHIDEIITGLSSIYPEQAELPSLPPGRYHYTEETKLNAISLLVASKDTVEYEIVEKGIKNLGKMDLHSALYALASLDL